MPPSAAVGEPAPRPRAWKIDDDRALSDEAYVPIRCDPFTWSIFDETARRLDYLRDA